ncbi:MAG: hypothetical protein GXX91_05265 [Verrucomicrobiaceae bacterium]|nr:hypothetical protein [Verrucomicrobiaceae bacterium]
MERAGVGTTGAVAVVSPAAEVRTAVARGAPVAVGRIAGDLGPRVVDRIAAEIAGEETDAAAGGGTPVTVLARTGPPPESRR